MSTRRLTGIVLGVVGVAVLLLATLFVTASQSRTRLAGQNGVSAVAEFAQNEGRSGDWCQAKELLPKDTAAIELALRAVDGSGPRLRIRILHGRQTVAHGTHGAGWSGQSVRVPLDEVVDRTISDSRLCVSVASGGNVGIIGTPAKTVLFDRVAPTTDNRMQVRYLRTGRESGWEYASTIVHRMTLGRAWSGSWIVAAIAILMAAVIVLVVRRLLAMREAPAEPRPSSSHEHAGRVRQQLRRVPTAAWACVAVGCLNAAAWGVIAPPFMTPDELDHVAYVQVLAETGHLPHAPTPDRYRYSQEEDVALSSVRFMDHARTEHVGIWTSAEQDRLQRRLAAPLERLGDGSAGTASIQPPLFYALQAVPYRLASSGSLLDRLALMRLLAALLAGVTVLFAFLLVREVLPGTPWAWTTAGLAVALQPEFAYVSGGVNPDGLLFASSSALFYCVARAFRRGVDARLAVAIGVVVSVGLFSKVTFLGLLPGALVGLVAAALRGGRLSSLRYLAVAASIGLAAVVLASLLQGNASAFDPSVGVDAASQTAQDSVESLRDQFVFIWQFYLPRLPGMDDVFGFSTVFEGWLPSFTGLFGYAMGIASHPKWVELALFVAAAIGLVLATSWLVRERQSLRPHAVELAAYALMALGLLAGIGGIAYLSWTPTEPEFLIQARYLFPLAALAALGVAGAARGAGSRWGPVAGAIIVMLVLGHDVASQLLAISGWYA